MFKRKILVFAFLFVIFSFVFSLDNNKVFAADVDEFENWLKYNSSELCAMLDGYDYLIVNNFYQNYLVLYYTNVSDNSFKLDISQSQAYGTRAKLSSVSPAGDNLFACVILNPNNDNNFVVPGGLLNEFTSFSGNNNLINNYKLDNILYASSSFLAGKEVIDTKKVLPLFTTLAPIVAKVESQGVLAEVIAILPMILVVVVFFLGLRKGLSMLLMLLRAS